MWVVIGVVLLLLLLLLLFPDNLRKIAGARSKSDRPCVHPANFQRERETDGGTVERRER